MVATGDQPRRLPYCFFFFCGYFVIKGIEGGREKGMSFRLSSWEIKGRGWLVVVGGYGEEGDGCVVGEKERERKY